MRPRTHQRPRASLVVVLLVGVLAAASSCRPDLGDRPSLVTRTRVLAVRAEPPEAHPGDAVTWSILVATPGDGTGGAGALAGSTSWAYCDQPVLLTENTSVSAACTSPGASLPPIAAGPTAAASVPSDACTVYGPEVPPGSDLRPHDPDATGGFYQPVRAAVRGDGGGDGSGETAFGFVRLECKLVDASADAATEFQARYVANHAPRITSVTGDVDGRAVDLHHVPRGARVHLVAAWGDGAEGAESYVAFDVASQTVVARRESMRVSWFADGGAFDEDRTGRAEDDPLAYADDGWTAPSAPGRVQAWVVLRDARGGIDFAAITIDVD